jgi:hypothetical protein
VLLGTGEPAGDAAVVIVSAAGPFPDIAPVTDSGGEFYLDGLQAGDWVLGAYGPGGEHGEAHVSVVAGSMANIVIQLA